MTNTTSPTSKWTLRTAPHILHVLYIIFPLSNPHTSSQYWNLRRVALSVQTSPPHRTNCSRCVAQPSRRYISHWDHQRLNGGTKEHPGLCMTLIAINGRRWMASCSGWKAHWDRRSAAHALALIPRLKGRALCVRTRPPPPPLWCAHNRVIITLQTTSWVISTGQFDWSQTPSNSAVIPIMHIKLCFLGCDASSCGNQGGGYRAFFLLSASFSCAKFWTRLEVYSASLLREAGLPETC